MVIEILAGSLLGLFLYRAGMAQGRYDRRKEVISSVRICFCDHSNNVHRKGGIGTCSWQSEDGRFECQCIRFTPEED